MNQPAFRATKRTRRTVGIAARMSPLLIYGGNQKWDTPVGADETGRGRPACHQGRQHCYILAKEACVLCFGSVPHVTGINLTVCVRENVPGSRRRQIKRESSRETEFLENTAVKLLSVENKTSLI